MGTTSQQFTVVGPQVSTGIMVAPGDVLRFSCTGYLDEGDHNLGEVIADGDGRAPDHHVVDDGAADASYPVPGGVRYALAGGILDPTNTLIDRFMIGRSIEIAAPAAGQLALFANDDKPSDDHAASGEQQTPWQVSVDVTRADPPPPSGSPGLRISDIQIMQVAQNAAGDCVLVGGKNTMVRAFVTVLDPTFLAGLSIVGSMVVTRTQGGTVGTFPALNPSGTSNAVVVTLAGTPVDRNATASSLNFEVPGTSLPVNADLSHYTFSVTASVLNEGTGGAFDAPGYTDTDQRSAGFASGFGLSVSLVLVSASVNGSPPILASAASWNAEQTEARLPIPDGTLNVQPSTPPVIAVAADVGGDGSGYADVLNFIRTEVTKQALKPANPGDRFVVLVPPNPSPPATGSVIGLSDMDQIAVVSADAKSPNTAAHELNHTLGLQHAASPGPGCLTPADVDATLPIAADAPGWTPIDSLIEGVGTAALMGYCPTTWPTAEEFSRGYRRLAGS